MPAGKNNNLIPCNERTKEQLSEMGRKGAAARKKTLAERRTMRERFLALRDMPLPKDQQTDQIKTYGDAWAYSMSDLVVQGKQGAVEAMKLMLAQIGEDVAEKQEIKVVYNNSEAADLMG